MRPHDEDDVKLLVRIDENVKQMRDEMGQLWKFTEKVSDRVGALEKYKGWLLGVSAGVGGVSALISWVLCTLYYLRK